MNEAYVWAVDSVSNPELIHTWWILYLWIAYEFLIPSYLLSDIMF